VESIEKRCKNPESEEPPAMRPSVTPVPAVRGIQGTEEASKLRENISKRRDRRECWLTLR
jgi:hypothetical protein